MKNRAGVPTGASRVCLSCHDGTIAVGQTLKGRIRVTGGELDGRIPAGKRANLGTDLRGSHPVSFAPVAGKNVHRPSGREVRLDDRGELQCTSCHDPHSEFGGTSEGMFLVAETRGAALCVACHAPAPGSSHATSAAPFRTAEGNDLGYKSVADASCAACHASHGADASGRLVSRRRGESLDDLCLRCHRGTVARLDIRADLARVSSHAENADVHEASEGPEGPIRLPETSVGARRHVTCLDCHDPHAASARAGDVGAVANGPLAGAWGIDVSGRRVAPASFEYEICFKCHADSANKPARLDAMGLGGRRRALEERNLRLAFGPSAASSHPVTAAGRNVDVPSLLPPWTPASLVACTDCHASSNGPGAGGLGARGPHGSDYPSLLERRYDTGDPAAESQAAYALCYKCHDRSTLLSDRSAFPLHSRHVVDGRASCGACHSPHGVYGPGASPTTNAHLIDFDRSVVQATGSGRPYETQAPRSGSCTLVCHGTRHDGARY
jgi:predicted CXXCH cytochrome family protein